MKRILLSMLVLCSFVGQAYAQTFDKTTGQQQTQIAPFAFNGQGWATAATSSNALNSAGMTVTALSPGLAYPSSSLPTGLMSFANLGTTTVYICWRGATCTTATGYPLAAGSSVTKALPFFSTQPPSFIAASSSAVVELEW